MPHAPPPLEAQTPQMTNAELASHLRTFAADQRDAKRISDKSYDRLRLAAERLHQDAHTIAELIAIIIERKANATSHSTGEG